MVSHNKLCLAIVAAASLSTNVQAQETEESGVFRLEEIIVTARLREEALQSTPLSITALSGDALTERNVSSVRTMLDQVPGVYFTNQGGPGLGNISMRGVTQGSLIGDEANVASFVDGFYWSGRIASDAFLSGLERVEVVRGPQSALYGRNSFSGAINYITKAPEFEESRGGLTFTSGDEGRRQYSGYFTGPLSDSLAVRIDATRHETGSTWELDNSSDRLDDYESNSLRLRLSSNPAEALSFDYTYTYLDRESTPPAVFEVPLSDLDGGYTLDFATFMYRNQKLENPKALSSSTVSYLQSDEIESGYEVDRHTLRLNYNSDSMLTSLLLAYTEEEMVNIIDATNGAGGSPLFATMGIFDFADNSFTTLPQPSLVDLDGNFIPDFFPTVGGQPIQDREDFSVELRFQSNSDGPLNWAFGGFYSKLEYTDILVTGYDIDDTTFDAAEAWIDPTLPMLPSPTQIYVNAGIFPATYSCNIMVPGACMGPPVILDRWGRDNILYEKDFTNEETSVFASIGYEITDATRIQVEARYTSEDRKLDDIREVTLTYPNEYPETQSEDYSSFTPRVILDHQVNDDTFLYFVAGKGAKAGGIQPSRPQNNTNSFDPEENWTYEIGSKFTFLDGHLNLNLAAFYVDWSDMQLRENVNLETIVTNVGEAEVRGFEIMGAWRVHENVQFRYGYTYQDGEITSGSTASARGFCDMPDLEHTTIPISATQAGILALDPVGAATCNLVLDPPGIPFVSAGTIDVTTGDISGNQLSNSPEQTMVYGLDVNIPFSNNMEFFTLVDYTYRSETYSDFENFVELDATTLINAQIGIKGEKWRAALWGENITDEDTPISAIRTFNILGQVGLGIQQRQGAQYGVTLSYDF